MIRKIMIGLSEDDAFSEEERLIALYGRKCDGGTLANISFGGYCPSREYVDPAHYKLVHYTGREFFGRQRDIHITLGIPYPQIHLLVRGKVKNSCGWFLNEVDSSGTSLIGIQHHFFNINTGEDSIMTQQEFSNTYGISRPVISSLVKRKIDVTGGGWVLWDMVGPVCCKQKDLTAHRFVHHSGEIRFMTVEEFKNTIDGSSKVLELLKGTRNSVRGWGYNNPPKNKNGKIADNTVRKFINIVTGEEFHGTRSEMVTFSGCNKDVVYFMVFRGTTSKNGWRMDIDHNDF